MKFLPLSSTILEYCGAWPSPKYYSGWKKILYDLYTILIVLSVFTFCLSGIIQVCIFTHSIRQFVSNSYMLLTFIAVFFKVLVIVAKRDHLSELFESVQAGLCEAKNEEERRIKNEWDPKSSFRVQGFRTLVMSTVIIGVVSSIKGNAPSRTLQYGGWFPFNHTEGVGYWTAFIYQRVAHDWGTLIGSTTDAVIYGIMMQTCAQLKILKCRLRKIPETIRQYAALSKNENDNYKDAKDTRKWESKIIIDCIKHHLLILQFADICNGIFAIVIFLQFSASGLVVCISVIMLSKLKFMSPAFTYISFYLSCMLSQIFLYCWFGNEVITESSDIYLAIYEMNWPDLSLNTKKDLLIIMARSVYPIEFTSGHVVTLSINSFNAVMKLSYSVYNVIGQRG
uniref:Odorant receptor n=1 Tax=Meteorus pulchricornis TaxID=51522 RepID=A0A1S5VFP7_9HYME|nr:olfactory receptor 55 [Meteorus pulchricornis]